MLAAGILRCTTPGSDAAAKPRTGFRLPDSALPHISKACQTLESLEKNTATIS